MNKYIKYILLFTYSGLFMISIFWALSGYNFLSGMLIFLITFPLGGIFVAIASLLPIVILDFLSYKLPLLLLFTMFALGYYQWFIFLPKVFKKKMSNK